MATAELVYRMARLAGVPGAERARRVDETLEQVGLDKVRDRKIKKLSGGMLRRLGVAQALVAAVPEPDPDIKRKKRGMEGDVPSPIDRPSGCPFHPRCPLVQARCSVETPELREVVVEVHVSFGPDPTRVAEGVRSSHAPI